MSAHLDHDPFAPPRARPQWLSWVLALLAHALLVGAFVWKITPPPAASEEAVEAELWADQFEQAAPAFVAPALPKVTPPP
ncbi:Uncharacterised protein, partial [uncultured Comamonas sp.]